MVLPFEILAIIKIRNVNSFKNIILIILLDITRGFYIMYGNLFIQFEFKKANIDQPYDSTLPERSSVKKR